MNTLKRIKQFIDYKGLTNQKFEKEIGFSNGAFGSQLKKEGTIGVDKLENILSVYPEISPDWLLTGKGDMLKKEDIQGNAVAVITNPKGIPLIPIHALAGIGVGDMQINDRDVEDYYQVPLLERRGAKYLIPVAGNSMYPKYASGDLLACKNLLEITFIQWGKPYVLDTDQGAIVKRLFPHPTEDDLFICKSDNHENYPSFTINKKQIYKIAVVVGVIRLE